MLAVVLFVSPLGAQEFPAMVVGAEFASEVSVKLVTDEPVERPPRRPGDPLCLCRASLRTPTSVQGHFAGNLRVVLLSGESEKVSAEVAPGVRATLTCAVDATLSRAGLQLLVTEPHAGKVRYPLASTFSRPPARR